MGQLRIEVIDRVYAGILSRKSAAERIAMADASHRTARSMVLSRIGQLHPEWTEEQLQKEFLWRILGHGADRYLAARG